MKSEMFNISTAVSMSRLSELAYNSDLEKDPLAFSLSVRNHGFKLISTFNDIKTDTQGFVARNDNYAVAVFRGTTGSIVDISTDGKIRLIDGKHEGFLTAIESIEEKLLQHLKNLGSLPIFTTGHSLGGALAKMMILQHPTISWSGCYTFGSPPICSDQVILKPNIPIYRVINEGDIVPRSLDLNDAVYETAIKLFDFLVKFDESSANPLNNIRAYIKSVRPDIKMYSHLGEDRIYKRGGFYLASSNSLEIFNQILKSDPARIIDDHSIVNYINSLELAAKQNIIDDLGVEN